MKKQYFVILFFVLGTFAYSQTNMMKRVYEYDDAGNRVLRAVFELKSPAPPPPPSSSFGRKSADGENRDDDNFLIDDMGDIKLKVYPNPTNAVVYVDIENVDVVQQGAIHIYNTTGNLLGMQSISDLNPSIDLSSYPAGIYLINITINGKETKWKIVKK